MDVYGHAGVDSLLHESAAAPTRAAVQQPDAGREVLGASHPGNGLHGCGSSRWRSLRPDPLEGADGGQTLSGRADRKGPAPKPREASGRLQQVYDARSSAETEDRRGLRTARKSRNGGYSDSPAPSANTAPVGSAMVIASMREFG